MMVRVKSAEMQSPLQDDTASAVTPPGTFLCSYLRRSMMSDGFKVLAALISNRTDVLSELWPVSGGQHPPPIGWVSCFERKNSDEGFSWTHHRQSEPLIGGENSEKILICILCAQPRP